MQEVSGLQESTQVWPVSETDVTCTWLSWFRAPACPPWTLDGTVTVRECVVRYPGFPLTCTEFYTLTVVSHRMVIRKFGQIHFTYLAKYNFFLLRVLTYKWDKQYVLLLILMLSLSNSERFSLLFTGKKFRLSWWSQLQPFQSCLPLDFSHSPAPESILWHSPLPTSALFFGNLFLFSPSLKWY